MKKTTKILLLIGTLWPVVYMFVFMGFFFFEFMTIQNQPSGGPPTGFFIFFGLHLFTMMWMMALTVIYIVNIFRNERVTQDKKALWAVVIFLGNMIAMPIYWYLYIWKEPAPPEQLSTPE